MFAYLLFLPFADNRTYVFILKFSTKNGCIILIFFQNNAVHWKSLSFIQKLSFAIQNLILIEENICYTKYSCLKE